MKFHNQRAKAKINKKKTKRNEKFTTFFGRSLPGAGATIKRRKKKQKKPKSVRVFDNVIKVMRAKETPLCSKYDSLVPHTHTDTHTECLANGLQSRQTLHGTTTLSMGLTIKRINSRLYSYGALFSLSLPFLSLFVVSRAIVLFNLFSLLFFLIFFVFATPSCLFLCGCRTLLSCLRGSNKFSYPSTSPITGSHFRHPRTAHTSGTRTNSMLAPLLAQS